MNADSPVSVSRERSAERSVRLRFSFSTWEVESSAYPPLLRARAQNQNAKARPGNRVLCPCFFRRKNGNRLAGVLKARTTLGKIVLRFSDYSLKRVSLTRRDYARATRARCVGPLSAVRCCSLGEVIVKSQTHRTCGKRRKLRRKAADDELSWDAMKPCYAIPCSRFRLRFL